MARAAPAGSTATARSSATSRSRPGRYALWLPAGTLRVKGQAVCATLQGLPFEPCFNLNRTDEHSFRGSVSGFGFAYCDFTRRVSVAGIGPRRHSSEPMSLDATAARARQLIIQLGTVTCRLGLALLGETQRFEPVARGNVGSRHSPRRHKGVDARLRGLML